MQLNLLVLSYVGSATLTGGVALVVWRRRSLAGAGALALLMLAVTWWLVANAIEAAVIDRSTKIAATVVSYPGMVSVSVLYLLFVLGWTRQDGRLTRGRIALLFLVPAISVAMAATNEWHHLLWTSVTLVQAWGVSAVYAHGPWFFIEMVYAYVLVGAGLLALLAATYRYPKAYAMRLRLVFAASLVPITGSVLYAVRPDDSFHADLSSVSFAVSGLVATFAILRARVLDLAPVAWATLVGTLADAVIVLDPDGHVAARNASAARLLALGENGGSGVARLERRAKEIASTRQDAASEDVEIAIGPEVSGTAADQPSGVSTEPRWFNLQVTPLYDGQKRELGSLVVLHDVTEHHRDLARISELSFTDELTGLLNRRGFTMLAEQQIRTAARTRNRLWLLFADLDDMKAINDRHGHEAGDLALREFGRILKAAPFRAADIVGRIGGDEFAILATEISGTDGATLTTRFRRALERANATPGRQWSLKVSVGVAVFGPDHPESLDELMRAADRRMYRVKHSRPGRSVPARTRRRTPLVTRARVRQGQPEPNGYGLRNGVAVSATRPLPPARSGSNDG